MADRQFWLEVDEDEAMRGLESADQHYAGKARQLLDTLADAAVRYIESHVPVYSSYTLRHVDRSDLKWHPGGAGGGGEWEVVAGVKAGSSRHPLYVHGGTGEFGPGGAGYTGKGTEIVNYGRVHAVTVPTRMYFYSELYGRVIGVREVQGQKPQPFMRMAFRELQMYAAARVLFG